MCLAVPMKLVSRQGNLGIAEVGGVRTEVQLDLVDAQPGEHLIVHAGYAIQILDEEEAEARLLLFDEVRADAEAQDLP